MMYLFKSTVDILKVLCLYIYKKKFSENFCECEEGIEGVLTDEEKLSNFGFTKLASD